MRILLAIALTFVHGLSFAQTNCRAVDLPDHMEAVCVGDEKAVPAPETPATSAFQREVTRQQAVTEQIRVSEPAAAAPAPQPQNSSTAMPMGQTTTGQGSPAAVVHRQGRQQYKQGMDEARAARQKLISDLQQQQQQSQPAQ